MTIVVCLDDHNGMCFNHRRQSRDLHLCQRVAEISSGSALWLSDYSKTLFEGLQADLRVDPLFLEKAGKEACCFVEDRDVTLFLDNAERVIIFRWNRVYPADMKFPMHLLKDKWTKAEVSTFPGKSHQQITQEVYLR